MNSKFYDFQDDGCLLGSSINWTFDILEDLAVKKTMSSIFYVIVVENSMNQKLDVLLDLTARNSVKSKIYVLQDLVVKNSMNSEYYGFKNMAKFNEY